MWGLERLNRIWLLTVSCCARQTDVKLAGSQFEGSSQFLFEAHRQDCGQQLCRVSKSIWVNSQKYILGDTNYKDITFVFFKHIHNLLGDYSGQYCYVFLFLFFFPKQFWTSAVSSCWRQRKDFWFDMVELFGCKNVRPNKCQLTDVLA